MTTWILQGQTTINKLLVANIFGTILRKRIYPKEDEFGFGKRKEYFPISYLEGRGLG